MTIHTTEWTMTSDITPESAYRDGARVWRLSWLPGRGLTEAQARAGMELDELLSDPHVVHDRIAQARVDGYADRLGMVREQVIILLAKRMAERLHEELRRAGDPVPVRRNAHSYRLRPHVITPPYVPG
ncbi:hypothetical protein [Nocardia sp. NPDC057030]|uniref:hypothetical protein n=1 Tax=unclassified Nocardia TaxID=2637762 RepID=UPI00363B0A01